MASKANYDAYITQLNELYANYDHFKAELNNDRFKNTDDTNKNNENKKIVTFLNNDGSKIEKAIFTSSKPINTNEKEVTVALGHKGIWLNKEEVLNWKGPLPLSKYKLSEETPQIIKKTTEPVEFVQDISIRYLKPPPPPQHGDLIIKRESAHKNIVPPPQIIREIPQRSVTPEPIIIRERPPVPPPVLPSQVIAVFSDDPPPERKVIIEKMPVLPSKPAPIIIERWLPYEKQKRNVVRAVSTEVKPEKEKNIIIEWEVPKPVIKRQVKYLGVQETDPNNYIKQYGVRLKEPEEIDYNYQNINKYEYFALETKDNKLQSELDSLKNEIERLKTQTNLQIDTKQYDLIGDVEALTAIQKL